MVTVAAVKPRSTTYYATLMHTRVVSFVLTPSERLRKPCSTPAFPGRGPLRPEKANGSTIASRIFACEEGVSRPQVRSGSVARGSTTEASAPTVIFRWSNLAGDRHWSCRHRNSGAVAVIRSLSSRIEKPHHRFTSLQHPRHSTPIARGVQCFIYLGPQEIVRR